MSEERAAYDADRARRRVTEKAWQQTVVAAATALGWAHFHPYDMRRSDPGWPDLVLVRPPRLIVAELKTERGEVSERQRTWLALLDACGIETHVWRPRDWDAVEATLR